MKHEKQSSRTNAIRKQEIIAIPRQVETFPFPFRRVLLGVGSINADVGASWKPCFEERGGYRNKNEIPAARRVNSAGISALSRRLMSMERARALGRKRIDPRSYILEIEARRWAEEIAKRK